MKLQEAILDDLENLIHMNIGLRIDEKMDDFLPEREVKNRMFSFLMGNEYKVFIIKDEESELGYCVLNILLRPMYLRQLYIKDIYRNHGFGKQVINLLMEIMNIKELDTEVMYWNDDAIRFYEKNGFKKRYMGMRYTK